MHADQQSPRSVASQWVQYELEAFLAQELEDRAITVIPVIIDDCEIPPSLANRAHVDLRLNFPTGVMHLVKQLAVASDIDFSRLDSQGFEELVSDLLVALGFSVRPAYGACDRGVDLVASCISQDPFGVDRNETWLIEVKFYREQRVSVGALQQMLGVMATADPQTGLVVITNSQLTSVAREFLS